MYTTGGERSLSTPPWCRVLRSRAGVRSHAKGQSLYEPPAVRSRGQICVVHHASARGRTIALSRFRSCKLQSLSYLMLTRVRVARQILLRGPCLPSHREVRRGAVGRRLPVSHPRAVKSVSTRGHCSWRWRSSKHAAAVDIVRCEARWLFCASRLHVCSHARLVARLGLQVEVPRVWNACLLQHLHGI